MKSCVTLSNCVCGGNAISQGLYKTFFVVGVLGMLSLVFTPAYASNIILGPPGVGPNHLVSANDPLNYEIQFENDPGLATLPVQVLTIQQTLDSNLDFETFCLGEFGFGGSTYGVPVDSAVYLTRLSFEGYDVEFAASVELATGIATWIFTTINPDTGEIPDDPSVGFLPVNNNPPEGEGFVSYSVLPKSTVVNGDVIEAKTGISFDFNDPIDTPSIFNTINVTPAPEPSTMLLLGSGLIGLLGLKRKFKK